MSSITAEMHEQIARREWHLTCRKPHAASTPKTGSGEKPGTRPVHVREVLATLYHQLGIDPALQIRDSQNRPVSILPEAHPVHELIA